MKVLNLNANLILIKLEKQMNQEWLGKCDCIIISTKDHMETCKLKHDTVPLYDRSDRHFLFLKFKNYDIGVLGKHLAQTL